MEKVASQKLTRQNLSPERVRVFRQDSAVESYRRGVRRRCIWDMQRRRVRVDAERNGLDARR